MPLIDIPATPPPDEPQWTTLYDPPKNGQTPLDGEGNPCTSRIQTKDAVAKIAQGFTREPVGLAEPEPEKPAEKPKKAAKKK